MRIEKIISQINILINNGLYSYLELEPHLDSIVVQINKKLYAKFPLFSVVTENRDTYDYFPDEYIIDIIIPGTTARILEIEDEFETQYQVYNSRWQANLNSMAAEYVNHVPLMFKKPIDNFFQMSNSMGFKGNPYTGASNGGYYNDAGVWIADSNVSTLPESGVVMGNPYWIGDEQ